MGCGKKPQRRAVAQVTTDELQTCPSDFNRDSATDVLDLGALLAAWGDGD